MVTIVNRPTRCSFILAILVLSNRPTPSQPAPPDVKAPDVKTIVERSAKAAEADRKADSDYDYSETDTKADGTRKTYAVQMLYGSPYQELTELNGEPLSRDKQKEEHHKLEREKSHRQHESEEARSQRVSAFQAEENRDGRFLAEFSKAFNFKLTGEQELDHHQVWVIEATPLRGYRPIDKETRALTGMRGQLWIDKQTYQWVKVEAEVTHPVSIIGFVATVEPGTRFELEKIPVGDGSVWLPRHFAMTSNAKVLEIIHRKAQEDNTYFNYHRTAE